MKSSFTSAIATTNQQVLHHFILGMDMEEIAETMDFKLETINKVRLELFKIFGATSLIELCKKAIEYGYAKALLENLDRLRKSHEFGSLSVWEVIYLHEYLKGHSEFDLLRILEIDAVRLNEIRQSVYKKLEIKKEHQVLFKAIVSGYVKCVPVPVESIPSEIFDEKYKEWKKTQTILKLQQFELKEASRLWHVKE